SRLMHDTENHLKLSRWVYKHASEWGGEADYKKQVKDFLDNGAQDSEDAKEMARRKYDRLEAKIANLSWWPEVSKKVKDFPSSPVVYHFNPAAFLEQLRRVEGGLFFPLRSIPYNHPDNFKTEAYKRYDYTDYTKRAAPFGCPRDSSRLHAACDLYTNVGEQIYSIADGKVLSVTKFYMDTWQITIEHDYELVPGYKMVVRYGEVSKSPGDIFVKQGEVVRKGQLIGKVGQLIRDNGKLFKQPEGELRGMLHFEMYTGEDTGSLTISKNNTPPTYSEMRHAKSNYNAGRSFLRRKDLWDPLPLLQSMYKSSSLSK
ncbi:MAG TPA: M23 family metallopeptidase, partial [Marinilabiliaceae bacterium]|nr:M23 family metallopeptidase [Marinilabiliaceae bacterium]